MMMLQSLLATVCVMQAPPGDGVEAQLANPVASAAESAATDGPGAADGPSMTATLLAGGGVAIEGDDLDAPYAIGVAELHVMPGLAGFGIGATARYQRHHEGYTVRRPAIRGEVGFETRTGGESWWDTRLVLDYDVLHGVAEGVALRVGVAPRFTQFLSAGFDNWLVAVEGRLALEITIAPRVALGAHFGLSGVVASAPEDARSIGGLAAYIYDFGLRAAVVLVDDLLALEVRWIGHALVFEFADRVYHAGAIGLSLTL